MATGDFLVFGPLEFDDNAAIIVAMSGNVVVGDDIVSWADKGQVWFGVVKA